MVPDPVLCVDLACADLESLAERVASSADIVILRREGQEDVALISARELGSITETLHLLKSRINAERLWDAIADVDAGRGGETMTAEDLRKEVGLEA
jgi:antitoxin YefM